MNRQERRRLQKQNKNQINPHKLLLKAIDLHSNKKYSEASEIYKDLFKKFPNDYDLIRHMGILEQDIKNYDSAYKYFKRALEIKPNGFEALNNLGAIHQLWKDHESAKKNFEKSYSLNPNYVPTINNLAGFYFITVDPEMALKFSSKALELQPQNVLALNQYAKSLLLNGRPKEAIKIFEKALSFDTNNESVKLNLVNAYKEVGQFDKSNDLASELFLDNYKAPTHLAAYVVNKQNILSDKHIKYYEQELKNEKNSDDDKSYISLALFDYYRNRKNYEKSGQYLISLNEHQYAQQSFDLDNETKCYEKLKKIFAIDKKIKVNKKATITPIFICGMPRSGTTLCEQILSSHSLVAGAGELNYLINLSGIGNAVGVAKKSTSKLENILKSDDELIKIREKYLSKLKLHNEDNLPYVCDKMPHNFMLIGLIRMILPEAKIIYCKRNPIDNCFSIYRHKWFELSHQYSYNQKVLANYYKLHSDIMSYWIKKYDNDIFILDNELLVGNQEKLTKQILKFCNLEWEENCLNFYKTDRQVRTASIEQVRQPLNNKSIGAWKKYEKYLTELVNGLN